MKAIIEIQYTCQVCGNQWHKLPSTEGKSAQACSGGLAGASCFLMPCCFPLYLGMFAATQKDKVCKKCQSTNISRKEITHDENQPKEEV